MERKWGVGRARLLSDLLRAKFDAQKDKLDAAIANNREQYIRAQAEGMKRAWSALDKAASEARHLPLSAEVWECALPSSGNVIAIVRTVAEAHQVCARCVFTLEEIGRLIEALGPTTCLRRNGVSGDGHRHPQTRDRWAERRCDRFETGGGGVPGSSPPPPHHDDPETRRRSWLR